MSSIKPKSDLTSGRLGTLFQYLPGEDLQSSIPAGFTKEFAEFYRIAFKLGQPVPGISEDRQSFNLDSAQERSFWILWNWWLTFRQQLEVTSDAPASEWPRHAAEGKLYELEEPPTYSDYFFAAWALFRCEFFDTGNPFQQKEVHERRIDAAIHSACYHAALSCVAGASSQFGSQGTATLGVRRKLGSRDLSGLHPSCHTGSSIDPCSWIRDASELPFYLWDIRGGCTIEVQTLGTCPEYTAISHTWGRWRTEGFTKLHGVREWTIPLNSLFDVAHLPDILAEVPVSTPYIWFDLVCIPQLKSDRADEEIAKQASIFRQAAHTIIWFNGIEDWGGLRFAMVWMSQVYLKQKPDTPHLAFGNPTGLFEDYQYDANVSPDDMKAVGWFSSLWTLQEICLRPDMWLCNRNWELFTTQEGVPISFNTIVALVAECRKDINSQLALNGEHQLDLTISFHGRQERLRSLIGQGLYPRGFVELLELFDRTGLQHLHVIKKDYILLLGSQRYCESHRADAIMSVLDTKAWRSLPEPGELVLGQYPLEFVREVAQSIGAAFFNSLSSRPIDYNTLFSKGLLPQGSLMPFEGRGSQNNESKLLQDKEFGDEQENPSIKKWIIQQDGSVDMPEAPILTSTHDNGGFEMIGSIWLTYLESDDCSDPRFNIGWPEGRRLRSCDIHQWCKTYYPETANYVVELSRVFRASRGVLLKESSPGSKVLYKVGNYLTSIHRTYGSRVMASATDLQRVDWKVL